MDKRTNDCEKKTFELKRSTVEVSLVKHRGQFLSFLAPSEYKNEKINECTKKKLYKDYDILYLSKVTEEKDSENKHYAGPMIDYHNQ